MTCATMAPAPAAKLKALFNPHAYRLVATATGDVGRCPECCEVDELIEFSTVRGSRERKHDGAFCSTACHDRWHGLLPSSR